MKQSMMRNVSPKKVPGDPYKQPVPMPKHPQLATHHHNHYHNTQHHFKERKRFSKQVIDQTGALSSSTGVVSNGEACWNESSKIGTNQKVNKDRQIADRDDVQQDMQVLKKAIYDYKQKLQKAKSSVAREVFSGSNLLGGGSSNQKEQKNHTAHNTASSGFNSTNKTTGVGGGPFFNSVLRQKEVNSVHIPTLGPNRQVLKHTAKHNAKMRHASFSTRPVSLTRSGKHQMDKLLAQLQYNLDDRRFCNSGSSSQRPQLQNLEKVFGGVLPAAKFLSNEHNGGEGILITKHQKEGRKERSLAGFEARIVQPNSNYQVVDTSAAGQSTAFENVMARKASSQQNKNLADPELIYQFQSSFDKIENKNTSSLNDNDNDINNVQWVDQYHNHKQQVNSKEAGGSQRKRLSLLQKEGCLIKSNKNSKNCTRVEVDLQIQEDSKRIQQNHNHLYGRKKLNQYLEAEIASEEEEKDYKGLEDHHLVGVDHERNQAKIQQNKQHIPTLTPSQEFQQFQLEEQEQEESEAGDDEREADSNDEEFREERVKRGADNRRSLTKHEIKLTTTNYMFQSQKQAKQAFKFHSAQHSTSNQNAQTNHHHTHNSNQQNSKKRGIPTKTMPKQLDPNPMFNLLEKHMDQLNKTTNTSQITNSLLSSQQRQEHSFDNQNHQEQQTLNQTLNQAKKHQYNLQVDAVGASTRQATAESVTKNNLRSETQQTPFVQQVNSGGQIKQTRQKSSPLSSSLLQQRKEIQMTTTPQPNQQQYISMMENDQVQQIQASKQSKQKGSISITEEHTRLKKTEKGDKGNFEESDIGAFQYMTAPNEKERVANLSREQINALANRELSDRASGKRVIINKIPSTNSKSYPHPDTNSYLSKQQLADVNQVWSRYRRNQVQNLMSKGSHIKKSAGKVSEGLSASAVQHQNRAKMANYQRPIGSSQASGDPNSIHSQNSQHPPQNTNSIPNNPQQHTASLLSTRKAQQMIHNQQMRRGGADLYQNVPFSEQNTVLNSREEEKQLTFKDENPSPNQFCGSNHLSHKSDLKQSADDLLMISSGGGQTDTDTNPNENETETETEIVAEGGKAKKIVQLQQQRGESSNEQRKSTSKQRGGRSVVHQQNHQQAATAVSTSSSTQQVVPQKIAACNNQMMLANRSKVVIERQKHKFANNANNRQRQTGNGNGHNGERGSGVVYNAFRAADEQSQQQDEVAVQQSQFGGTRQNQNSSKLGVKEKIVVAPDKMVDNSNSALRAKKYNSTQKGFNKGFEGFFAHQRGTGYAKTIRNPKFTHHSASKNATDDLVFQSSHNRVLSIPLTQDGQNNRSVIVTLNQNKNSVGGGGVGSTNINNTSNNQQSRHEKFRKSVLEEAKSEINKFDHKKDQNQSSQQPSVTNQQPPSQHSESKDNRSSSVISFAEMCQKQNQQKKSEISASFPQMAPKVSLQAQNGCTNPVQLQVPSANEHLQNANQSSSLQKKTQLELSGAGVGSSLANRRQFGQVSAFVGDAASIVTRNVIKDALQVVNINNCTHPQQTHQTHHPIISNERQKSSTANRNESSKLHQHNHQNQQEGIETTHQQETSSTTQNHEQLSSSPLQPFSANSLKNRKKQQQIPQKKKTKSDNQSEHLRFLAAMNNNYQPKELNSGGNGVEVQKGLENSQGISPLLLQQQSQSVEKPQKKEFVYADPGVQIGQGKFGPVKLIIRNKTLMALKVIPKTSVDVQKRFEHVKNEKSVLLELMAPQLFALEQDPQQTKKERFDEKRGPLDFVVKLHETFLDYDNVNFVFEYLPGQDLMWILANEHNLFLGKSMSRRDWVRFFCAEILVAIDQLHQRHIIYRDLKPENVMIDKEGHAKLIDFGFAKKLASKNDWRTTTNCGTVGYTAPEVLTAAQIGYSFQVDLWSFAILITEMLSGCMPFEDANDPIRVQEQIVACKIKFNKEGVDLIARDLLSKIFIKEPNLRPNLEQIKSHRFFMGDRTSDYWDQVATKTVTEPPYKPNPLKYQYLLQNDYPQISNLDPPKVRERNSSLRQSYPKELPSFGGLAAVSSSSQNQNATKVEPMSAGFKLGDPIGEKPQKGVIPKQTGDEMGLFGMGIGKFDKNGKQIGGESGAVDKASQGMSPLIVKKNKGSLLGDFTLYRVNKEFENF